MEKHTLVLLNHWHDEDGSGPFYCPDCASVEGFLRYAPDIENHINVIRVDFQRPRQQIIDLVGSSNQGSPVLVFAHGAKVPLAAKTSLETGRAFVTEVFDICDCLAREFGCVRPHP